MAGRRAPPAGRITVSTSSSPAPATPSISPLGRNWPTFAGQYVLLWRDRYTPPAEDADADVGAHPYLGAGHEYLEKTPGTAPLLRDIHVQNPAGFVSFGVPTGDVPSMKRDIPAIVGRISQDLLLADLPAHEKRMTGTVPPDFTREMYATAIR